jgi:L,D-transpeptidase-like protein
MPAVTRRRSIAFLAAGLAATATGSLPALAAGDTQGSAATSTTTTPSAPAPQAGQLARKPAHRARRAKPAHLSLHLHGVHHGKVRVGDRARAAGYLRPFVAGEHVRVKLLRRGHVIQELNPKLRRVRGRNAGRYRFRSPALIKPASYRIVVKHLPNGRQGSAMARSRRFHISYPDLDPGDRNSAARIFNRLLRHEGYYSSHGKRYSKKTRLAVMAFRKTNGMKRTFNASPRIFKKLAAGRGSFHLKHPGAGKHVEVDISRQVMVLARHRKPQYTIHVSTGAPATPTIRGHYRFYSRQPGYNSSGMYYSVYWHGGYAIHGYHSVPTYPASHGCIRNPIPQSAFIYDWVRLGMSIYVYG